MVIAAHPAQHLSRQYTEAEQARYTNPPLLLPKYDTQEELLEVWLKELDQTINYLSSNEIKDVLNNQDFIYKGDLKKWGKLANSLKLKIAARLINKDRNRAFEIVKQVAESPVGLIATTDDDFVYNKGKFDNNWNNDFSVGVGTQHLIDFLVNNKDPRLLYFFQKNDYNSNVVQAYFDQKREMPDFVEKNVISEVKDGKKVFKEWGGPGEPWVRYYGLPVEISVPSTRQTIVLWDQNNPRICPSALHLFPQEGHNNVPKVHLAPPIL